MANSKKFLIVQNTPAFLDKSFNVKNAILHQVNSTKLFSVADILVSVCNSINFIALSSRPYTPNCEKCSIVQNTPAYHDRASNVHKLHYIFINAIKL